MLTDPVPGDVEIPVQVIEAGTEVQLPDLSTKVGTWLLNNGRSLVIYAGAQKLRKLGKEA